LKLLNCYNVMPPLPSKGGSYSVLEERIIL
jgi:hypothetical protein